MNDTCPTCGLRFAREPGYYTGAMYVSYALAAPVLGLCTLLFWALVHWPLEWSFAAAAVVLLLCTPAIFRYSRVAWIHFDRWTEPEDEARGS